MITHPPGVYSFYITGDINGVSNVASFDVTFVDPCTLPNSFTVGAQTNPPDYLYTGSSPSMIFNLSPVFVSDPPNCEQHALYTCVNTGPRTDMCSQGTFDPTTGSYTFSTTDQVAYPYGVYSFDITGSMFGATGIASFDVELVDPCTRPNSFTVGAQTNPSDYHYTGLTTSHILNPVFVSDPPSCESYATYTCSNTGPRTDMCTVGIFNAIDGSFSFSTADMVQYPPGVYSFDITGDL